MKKLFGGIEGGGTKFICGVGTQDGNLLAKIRFPTTTPAETLAQAVDFLVEQTNILGQLASIGFASFGPVDINPRSPKFGQILSTPKPGWTNADVLGAVRSTFKIPIFLDTDVNAAALGEWRWGAAQHLETFIYLTIGTGIGGGGLANGKLMHGLLHPEMGHISIPHDLSLDPFKGICPFHGDCFEGLASGPAMEKRWGTGAENLPPGHPAWDMEAHYIALALRTYIYAISPQRIIVGGGIGQQPHLLSLVRQKTWAALNGYMQSSATQEKSNSFIVPPILGSNAGLLGAIALAQHSTIDALH